MQRNYEQASMQHRFRKTDPTATEHISCGVWLSSFYSFNRRGRFQILRTTGRLPPKHSEFLHTEQVREQIDAESVEDDIHDEETNISPAM